MSNTVEIEAGHSIDALSAFELIVVVKSALARRRTPQFPFQAGELLNPHRGLTLFSGLFFVTQLVVEH
jgi:hypothetical protein